MEAQVSNISKYIKSTKKEALRVVAHPSYLSRVLKSSN